MKILLVEDNPADARIIRELLRSRDPLGLELWHATQFCEATSELGQREFDLVLLDLGLPDSQGLATLARMNAQTHGRVPLIVLTGLDDEAVAVEAVRRGAQDFLVKTELAIDPLSRTVRYALERHRLHQTLVEKQEQICRLNGELEQRVRERTAQLQAVNKELESIAYSISHDLRAPLRHISGFVGRLQKGLGEAPLFAQCRHYLEQITGSARDMGQLIDELLRFCRTGRAELHHQRTELCQVLERALGEIAEETNGRKITWRKNALPAVWADPVMLRQVFINLLANAVKYTRPRAEAVIEIGCLEDTPNETVIFVRDNGVGFDMRYADKLFGIFQRLHANEDFEGTGIGLANVRRIIARHGGRTWADAKVDEGATLYFSLPKANHETEYVDSQNHFAC